MSPENCSEHQRAMELLRVQLERGVLPHAHLFTGPEGVGRLEAARTTAEAILCEENPVEPCGVCRGCTLFRRGEHPDYHEYSCPEGRQSLPIESIRQLQSEASRKPALGKKHVFVIRDAERMSLEAANCFLKTLEEPPGECYIILIVAGLSNLPDTIVSRCQIVRFTTLNPEAVEERLRSEGAGDADAGWLALRSWGSPGRAIGFYREGLHEMNRLLVAKLLSLEGGKNFEMSDYLQECAGRLGASASEQRRAIQELLECAGMLFRDLAALIVEPDAVLFNEYCRDEIERCARGCELDDVLECADMTLTAIGRIGANVNRRLVLDDLFSSLPEVLKRSG